MGGGKKMADVSFIDFEKSVHEMNRKQLKTLLKVIFKNLFSFRFRRNKIKEILSMPSPAIDSLIGIAGTKDLSAPPQLLTFFT